MKPTLVLIGCLSLAFAGCGGAPSNVNNAVAATEPANAAPAVSQFASITDATAALTEGKRLLDENQTETAIDALKRAVELDADLAEAHFQLGVAYDLLEMQNEQSGKVTEPAANSKDAVKKSKSDKAFEDAVKAYKKWIAKNPKDDNAYYYLGRTYAKLTKDEDAEEAFQEAVKLKPDDSEYQTELGGILIKLAKYNEAIKPLKKAIDLDTANARAIDLLEDAEAGKKRFDYVSNKNSNTTVPGKSSGANSNSNSNSSMGSNSNSATPSNPSSTKPPEGNSKPKKPEPEPKGKKGDPKDDRPRTVPGKPTPKG